MMADIDRDTSYWQWLQELICEHITDDDARGNALHCLLELRRLHVSSMFGCRETIRHLYEQLWAGTNEPTICPIPDELWKEWFLWQDRIRGMRDQIGSEQVGD
jgi:hypothetical protein